MTNRGAPTVLRMLVALHPQEPLFDLQRQLDVHICDGRGTRPAIEASRIDSSSPPSLHCPKMTDMGNLIRNRICPSKRAWWLHRLFCTVCGTRAQPFSATGPMWPGG